MKKISLLLIAVMALSFTNCNSQTNPETIGKDLFSALQNLSNSKGDDLATNFLKKEDGHSFYKETIRKSKERGVADWSKIRYENYYHKEFEKNGIKYSSAFLVVKLNGNSDYTYFGIWLLNIQVGKGYKVMRFNDEWSRSSSIPADRIMENLDGIAEEWVD